MFKLPDDFNSAYESVKDTLGAARSICVSILNEEEAKESPDQAIIDKYEKMLKEIFHLKHNFSAKNRDKWQEISDEYVSFVRSRRGLPPMSG